MPDTRILLVEDESTLRETMYEYLSVDYQVIPVASLAGARSALRRLCVDDVVLLDLGLPDGEGLSLLPEIRGHADGPAVIILTGNDDLACAKRAISEGADDYIVKSGHLIQELSIRIPMSVERRRHLTFTPGDSGKYSRLGS
jgi:DNA-binding response OmpR family regulator